MNGGNETTARWGLTVLRVVVGVVFAAHGGQKLFVYGLDGVEQSMAGMGIPLPGVSAVLVTLTELLGGLALVAGLFTRLAAVPLAITMAVAMLAVHLPGGFFAPNGIEYMLTLLAASVALGLTGPGALAADNLLAARTRRRAAGEAPKLARAA
jgi:putative oxidoreductase